MTRSDLRADFDPITLEVIRMRLDNIVEEMGIAMIRSSGSPVITEARDYNTALFDHQGRFFSYSDAVQLHIGSGGVAVRSLLEAVPTEEMHPGDAFISNDPHTAGSSHPPDTTVISPIFFAGTLVGFAQSQAHLVDVGGMTPGGFAPAARDCYAEALRLPPGMKIFDRGEPVDAMRRLIANNVRVPVLHWNDIRSMVASNNTGIRRLQATIEEFGLDEFRNYTALSFELAEEVLRQRIREIPDGTFHSEDWVEGNGHDDGLIKVACTMTVSGDSIAFDFAGSSPQTDGFVNCSFGALVGSVATAAVALLGWDVPFNEGVMRAFDVTAPRGTVVNPDVPAPVSNGHLTTGVRATRLVTRLLSQACVRSGNLQVSRRVQGEWGDSWTGGITAGTRRDTGEFFVWFNMDGGGTGTGAQVTGDGLDAGGAMGAVGNMLPDVEMNELLYPSLYLWKRLAVDSCGPGTSRGGMGIDFAWTLWGAEETTETVFSPTAAVPPWGFAGGCPGGGSGFAILRDTNLDQLLSERLAPDSTTIEAATVEELPVNAQGVALRAGDVLHCWIAGGGGMGDPLLRPASQVVADVRDSYVSPELARSLYGVVVDRSAEGWDAAATDAQRTAIRRARLADAEPAVSPTREVVADIADAADGIPTVDDDGEWRCPACRASLGTSPGWTAETVAVSRPAAARLADHGVKVRDRSGGEQGVWLEEHYCRHCGTQVQTQLLVKP
ncbi:hydantoinase B/oxoprolinase family protein [Streptomyces sp. NPDC059916]|uniref:hydantoinase B/oxoprolinase family protein n=1 Tax=Streptomyces sp. NPDC059916 TaxID=3347001 RepID=UPI0036A6EE81